MYFRSALRIGSVLRDRRRSKTLFFHNVLALTVPNLTELEKGTSSTLAAAPSVEIHAIRKNLEELLGNLG
jgi:hypothetical protein